MTEAEKYQKFTWITERIKHGVDLYEALDEYEFLSKQCFGEPDAKVVTASDIFKILDERVTNAMPTRNLTPLEAVELNTTITRQLGKTTRFIEALPHNKYLLIVIWSHHAIKHMREKIANMRPDIDPRNIMFVVSKRPYDILNGNVVGHKHREVYVEPAVLELWSREIVLDLNKYFNPDKKVPETYDDDSAGC